MKKIYFLILSFLLFVFSNVYSQKDIVNGLKAYYPFSGNANDVSGNNYHGTVHNAALTGDRFSNSNSAYDFNPSNFAYIQLPALVKGLSQGTVSLWFYAYSWAPGSNGIALYASGEVSFDVFLLGSHPVTGSNQLVFGLFDTTFAWHWVQSTIIPVVNRWYHIAATWGSSGMKIYVNGLFCGINIYALPVFTKNTFIDVMGASTFSYTNIDAKIDEVRVYDRELAAGDITELYNGSTSIPYHNNKEIQVFPNPAGDIIYITGQPADQCSYEIYDMVGKIVTSGILNQRIDLTGIKNGIYNLSISDPQGQVIKNIKLFRN